jgi:hypothetical protein
VSSRNFLVSVLVACSPILGFLGVAPLATGAWAGQSVLKPDKTARNYGLKNKRRVRGAKIRLPVGPSYIYYDYPYYYARGYYPTHIGGYVYYPSYYGYRSHYRGAVPVRRQRLRRKQ